MELANIIEHLLIADTDVILKATEQLEEAFKYNETIPALLNIMAGHAKAGVRQYAAILLRRRLKKHYDSIPIGTRQLMKEHMLSTVFSEKERKVRGSMTQFLGCLLQQENRYDVEWTGELLQKVLVQCNSSDEEICRFSTFILAKLADAAPDELMSHFNKMNDFIRTALAAAGSSNINIPDHILDNIFTFMINLVPSIADNPIAAETFQAGVPYIVQAMQRFAAVKSWESFSLGIDLLQSMVEFAPNLLKPYVGPLFEYALNVGSDQSYGTEFRNRMLLFVCWKIGKFPKAIVKLNIIEPIVTVLFDIITKEPEDEIADEFFDNSEDSPLSSATYAIDHMAQHLPPEKFIEPVLSLVQTAVQNSSDDSCRRAAYIVLATVSFGCNGVICEYYMEPTLSIVKKGLEDPSLRAHIAALFAIGQFAENLHPEINEHASEILPILLHKVHAILASFQTGQELNYKYVESVFYALEKFICEMDEAVNPYLQDVMNIICLILNDNSPQRFKIFALNLIIATAEAYSYSLVPSFERLIDSIRPFIEGPETNESESFRAKAIDTFAAIIFNVNEHYIPYAWLTINQCICWIERSYDPDVRCSLLNLFDKLGPLVGEQFKSVLPILLKHINSCIQDAADKLGNANSVFAKDSDDDDEDDNTESTGHNPYLDAKQQAIESIKNLAQVCPKALLTSIPMLMDTMDKILADPYMSAWIRTPAIDTIVVLVLKWFELDNATNVQLAIQSLVRKLARIVNTDGSSEIVVKALDALHALIMTREHIALCTIELRDCIGQSIENGLTYKYACFQGEDDDDDDYNTDWCNSIVVSATNLLELLSEVVTQAEFSSFFARVEPHLMTHILKTSVGNYHATKGCLIGQLADCYEYLGNHAATYFQKHIDILSSMATDKHAKVRQNAIYGIGEIVTAVGEAAYASYPSILTILSLLLSNEKNKVVLEYVIGALAHLTLANLHLMPLMQIIPIMIEKLPAMRDDEQYGRVYLCLLTLLERMPVLMKPHAKSVVHSTIRSIAHHSFKTEAIEIAVKLLLRIKQQCPHEYNAAQVDPALLSFWETAHEKAYGRI